MHSPGLHTYPLWAQWLVRAVYFLTGYQVTPHHIGVAETEDQAREWLKNKNYFAQPVYLGLPLPEEGASPGPVIWGNEAINELYAKHSPDLVTMTRNEWHQLQTAVSEVCKASHAR